MVFQPAALCMIWKSKVDYIISKGIGERPVVPAVSEPVMGLEVGLKVESLAAALVLNAEADGGGGSLPSPASLVLFGRVGLAQSEIRIVPNQSQSSFLV